MFEPFAKGTGEDARPNWKNAIYTPGRFKAHAAPSPSKLRPPPTKSALSSSPSNAGERRGRRAGGASVGLPPEIGSSPGPYTRTPRLRRGGEAGAERLGHSQNGGDGGWWKTIMRPSKERVDVWLRSWWKRWAALVVIPCMVVWLWVAVPFPVADPYEPGDTYHWPKPWSPSFPFSSSPSNPSDNATSTPSTSSFFGNTLPLSLFLLFQRATLKIPARGIIHGFLSTSRMTFALAENGTLPSTPKDDGNDVTDLPLDLNFFFFLIFYFGTYLHVALLFMTKIFDLYRLNWWPKRIGGAISYIFFWASALVIGWVIHDLDLIRIENDHKVGTDWERKTFWITLCLATMACPALVCFSVLKRDKRHLYRQSLTTLQKAFLERQLSGRIPASYLRFLWFMAALGTALFALIAGQAYTSIYLNTLPHTSADAAIWVNSWVGTTTGLSMISSHILETKVRSKGLLFLFKYFNFLVYFVFYRNLFARLRTLTDFAVVQLLSSLVVICSYPFQMTSFCHKLLVFFTSYEKSLEEHRETVAINFHARSIAQNVSMVGFLGWLVILSFGPNAAVYPFFRFDPTPEDPYTFSLTFWASSVIWGSEIASSIVTRLICRYAFDVNIKGVGLSVFVEYPDLVPACGATSIHVLMNILFFLLKLNFR